MELTSRSRLAPQLNTTSGKICPRICAMQASNTVLRCIPDLVRPRRCGPISDASGAGSRTGANRPPSAPSNRLGRVLGDRPVHFGRVDLREIAAAITVQRAVIVADVVAAGAAASVITAAGSRAATAGVVAATAGVIAATAAGAATAGTRAASGVVTTASSRAPATSIIAAAGPAASGVVAAISSRAAASGVVAAAGSAPAAAAAAIGNGAVSGVAVSGAAIPAGAAAGPTTVAVSATATGTAVAASHAAAATARLIERLAVHGDAGGEVGERLVVERRAAQLDGPSRMRQHQVAVRGFAERPVLARIEVGGRDGRVVAVGPGQIGIGLLEVVRREVDGVAGAPVEVGDDVVAFVVVAWVDVDRIGARAGGDGVVTVERRDRIVPAHGVDRVVAIGPGQVVGPVGACGQIGEREQPGALQIGEGLPVLEGHRVQRDRAARMLDHRVAGVRVLDQAEPIVRIERGARELGQSQAGEAHGREHDDVFAFGEIRDLVVARLRRVEQEGVGAGIAAQRVVAGSAFDRIVAFATEDGVVALAAIDLVVSAETLDEVIPAKRVDVVV